MKIKKALKLFLIFFYIGVFTIGGGYAMIPLMKESLVKREKFLDEDKFLEIFAISQITPGPIAINMATFVGYEQGGFIGSLFATLGVVLPSLIIITLISMFFVNITKFSAVQKLFIGILTGIAGEIAYLTFDMGRKMKKDVFNISIFFLSAAELFLPKMNPIYVILIGGALGLIFGKGYNGK
jgi:chromate transporter